MKSTAEDAYRWVPLNGGAISEQNDYTFLTPTTRAFILLYDLSSCCDSETGMATMLRILYFDANVIQRGRYVCGSEESRIHIGISHTDIYPARYE